jgi:hypothetical protein
MDKNTISSKEALELVSKLVAEKISVQASLFSPSGLRTRFRGFVDSLSELNGIVVCTESPVSPNEGAWISVPISNRDVVCAYADMREFPDGDKERFAEDFGDTMLIVDFLDSKERFALTFTL